MKIFFVFILSCVFMDNIKAQTHKQVFYLMLDTLSKSMHSIKSYDLTNIESDSLITPFVGDSTNSKTELYYYTYYISKRLENFNPTELSSWVLANFRNKLIAKKKYYKLTSFLNSDTSGLFFMTSVSEIITNKLTSFINVDIEIEFSNFLISTNNNFLICYLRYTDKMRTNKQLLYCYLFKSHKKNWKLLEFKNISN